ncbi:Protein SGT1 [Grifola frondosa]|uniref:Protein SGT1 n=1 Tax=Grifola frondosa TaxID=5627 RepID=A0A1C7MTE3_GRIFR|nr:Protein SGT1 [Grifola frondosa]
MDVFNRPPVISEDTFQYTLHPQPDVSDRTSVTTLAALMDDFVNSLLPEHLWHRDSFELKVVSDPDDGNAWVLEGRMRVGDCVDDEWCAVWLLREISRKWDVVISIFDSDGEFLLIEAAESLPSWVTPSNAENRVWIYNSHMHLIPLSYVSAPSSKPRRRRHPGAKDSDDEGDIAEDNDGEDFISIPDALKVVRDPLVNTRAPTNVEQTVWQRISRYPAAARQHVHVTKAYLPVDIAKALSVNPSLIQKPVETFYTRDALQLRAAHKMSRFPPEPSILTSVKMTRTAYAQLVGQKFYPPKIFGRWQEREGTKEWRWKDIGMKIACGFEMLYQENKGRSDVSATSFDGSKSSMEARKDALRRNPDYIKYIQNLVSTGYFKGELEGSQLWNTLEDKAAAAFTEAQRDDDASRPSFTNAVNVAISQSGNSTLLPQEEDSDEWLNVNAEDFDAMLEKALGGRGSSHAPPDAMDVEMDEQSIETEEDRLAKVQATRLQELAKKVEEFVEGEGDIEGARFADEMLDEEFSDEESIMSDDASGEEHNAPQYDAERAARQAAMDKLVPGIEPSEYGKMPPSFHNHSQRVAPTTMETDVREEAPHDGLFTTEPRVRPIRPPILPRDRWDGVDSDDETDEDESGANNDDEEDQPQVVGEIEIDMAEEKDEFLEFARQALGVSDQQWGDIVRERRERGAFVPTRVSSEGQARHTGQSVESSEEPERGVFGPTNPRSNGDTNLDSFEAVMAAMDVELARTRGSKQTGNSPAHPIATDKGKRRSVTEGDNAVSIEAAMEAELQGLLDRCDDDADEDENIGTDYNLIKNFLESFKGQGGLPGPVSNLAGRLQQGWILPRDDS